MTLSLPKYDVGSLVQRINQPEMIGRVAAVQQNPQTGTYFYTVDFSGGRKGVPESSLTLFQEIVSAWEALRSGRVSGREHYQTLLTFHRLKKPPSRIASSYATAKTTFYPYQFKPLLKFLDNPGKRILIADEVGLGKTIEAGYILKELRAHQDDIDKILVLVPSRLRTKWKRELSNRFDEPFDLAGKQEMIRMAERVRRGKEPEPFRWIVSYESCRTQEVIEAYEETQIPIDILIADEVHWMRNSVTLQHQLGRTLTGCADVAIFLSATPVQNGMQDLHTILRILYPERFSDFHIFGEAISTNSIVLSLQNVIRAGEIDREEALDLLVQYEATSFGREIQGTALYESIKGRLSDGLVQRREIAELQADLSRLSPIGHILSRSKKRDVQENAPVRDAMWVSVALTHTERAIYDSVSSLCRLAGMGGDTQFGFQMALMMAYRITSSCIPASADYFRAKAALAGFPLNPDLMTLEEVEREDNSVKEGIWQQIPRDRITDILEQYRSIRRDTKYSSMLKALRSIWEDDKGKKRKVVIFSYFPGTVLYLQAKLKAENIKCTSIHGGLPVSEREERIDEFLEKEEILVLLSTDVGAEGIDLQKASVVINYDLPWNPMVVEQRIGRIDRIGQTAKTIKIINLVIKDSIEETILERLLRKIEIFRQTIGEPDPIIGGMIEELTIKALSGELSPVQLKAEVERQGQVLSRIIHDARSMMGEVDKMISADQALVDEIGALIGERQIPTPNELLQFINRFLGISYPGVQIPAEASRRVVKVDLRGNLGLDMERIAGELGEHAGHFSRRVSTSPIEMTLSREAAYRHSRAELIHFKHPLSLFSIKEFEKSAERRQGAFALYMEKSPWLPSGIYGFITVFFEMDGRNKNRKMVAVFQDLLGGGLLSDQERTIPLSLEMLEKALDTEIPEVAKFKLEKMEQEIVPHLLKLKSDWDQREKILEQNRGEMQNATIKATLDVRIKRAMERFEALKYRDAPPFAIKMADARLQKVLKEKMRHEERSKVQMPWREIEYEEIACGILMIGEQNG